MFVVNSKFVFVKALHQTLGFFVGKGEFNKAIFIHSFIHAFIFLTHIRRAKGLCVCVVVGGVCVCACVWAGVSVCVGGLCSESFEICFSHREWSRRVQASAAVLESGRE